MAKVMGLDCSTNSLAYATVENGKLIDYGEFFFEGSDIHRRLVDVRKKVMAHIDHFDVNYICLEQAVMVRNVQVAMKLSEFFGAIKSIILEGSDVYQVKPMEWQKGIGNPTIVGKEKVKWLKEHPQYKTKSQILNGIRQYRKQVTMDWVEKQYGLKADNDNISDAVAIAHYASSKLVK